MKHILLIFLLSAIFTTCSYWGPGTRYKYDYFMSNPKQNKEMSFEDDTMTISFIISDKSINFILKNKTKGVLKINWDEVSLIIFNKALRVMHSGVKYINRNESQPPTVIPPNSQIEDALLPSDNIFYRSGYYGSAYSSPGGWEELDLFPTGDYYKQETRDAILKLKGEKFSLYLPIVFQDKKIDYTFEFTISDVKPLTGEDAIVKAKKDVKSENTKVANQLEEIQTPQEIKEEEHSKYLNLLTLSSQNQPILLDIINTAKGKYLLLYSNSETPMQISENYDIVRIDKSNLNEKSIKIGEAKVIQIKDNKVALQYTLSIKSSISLDTDKIEYNMMSENKSRD